MLQIQNTLVSLDLIERFFCCDLDACKGACCIDGDAGAPLTPIEDKELKEMRDEILPVLPPKARKIIEEEGQSYLDPDGDLVTQLIEGAACVYTCFDCNGVCLCALEKARREGNEHFFKPISCSLYPVRVTEYPTFTAVNFHKWKICRPAETLGRKKGLRAYEFLKGPLTRRFGAEWYEELALTARQYLLQNPDR